ncbi:MAG: caspase family protein [Treponema sp.]|nr:caspase family protein [Treponema sp.]
MKKIFFFVMIAFAPLAIFAQNKSGSSGVERYAVFIGSNSGGKNNQRLLYAGSDAISFQKTMSEIGGIPSSNAILLLDPAKDDLDNAMQAISEKIRSNKEKSKRSEFLFYYSGHSDENALLLGKSTYGYSKLKAAISNVPSDVHVVILDSCYSGNFIRTKGGQRQKPFLLDDSSVVKGHAYLSSSSSQESSQESDEIGSSFFTNAMLTGLRGAADSSGDKKVTLNELYSYAFNETLSKTENSSAGPQHPNYNITLVGSGDLVLSDISNSDSIVMLASDLSGRIIIRDKNGKLVSEINKSEKKPVYLALEKGEYSATLIAKNVTMQGSFNLRPGKVYELSSNSLSPVASSFNRLRGENGEELSQDESSVDSVEAKDVHFPYTLRDGGVYTPVELSLVNNELSRPFNKKVYSTLSLGLVRSSVYEADGAMFSIFINEAEFVRGVQAAGIYNTSKDLCGLQYAGIFNRSDEVKGMQYSGIFNEAKEVKGGQASGIFNRSEDLVGVQGAGIFNSSKSVKGLQAAGIGNLAGEAHGAQIAGIFNYAGKVEKDGVQIGLVNVAKEAEGIQLGLLNLSKNGVLEVGVSYTSNNNLRFALNSGNKHLYTVLGIEGYAKDFFKPRGDDESYGILLCGLGSRLSYGIFNFDIEGIGNFVAYKKDSDDISSDDEDEDGVRYDVEGKFYPSLRLSVGCTPIKHLQVFGAANISYCGKKFRDAFDRLETNIKLGSGEYKFYPEFEAGVRYSFN